MSIELGDNRYGKAEVRLFTVTRDGARHELTDLNVSIALSGEFEATHLTGDNAQVLPTDTQKNTVYAFAKEHGVGQIEAFGLLLARHFVTSHGPTRQARVHIAEYGWARLQLPAGAAPHSFARTGPEVRTAEVIITRDADPVVISGISGLVLLNSTGSEFHGFATDRYTTLPETTDRVLATEVSARWRHQPGRDQVDWRTSFDETRRHLLEAFAETHSLSLQQTLYAMGERVLQQRAEIAEVRLVLPNRHHLLVDLRPFGLSNDNEVFYPSDRPHGLIEGTVRRTGVAESDLAW
ncbi:MAG: urate oxidase [Sporichthyaceae bacterium]|nr:urate oxidase [Sporichthyaceae bacterium]